MHGMLGNVGATPENLTFTTLYEHKAIDRIIKDFTELVGNATKEEELQQFLSKNPIAFHFLTPQRLFVKPDILNKHETDFAIIDSRKNLWLIEIERPDILLLRKDGATSADMEHAISQVGDWLYQYEKHRAAVLDCMEIGEKEVTQVRGLVIAGRDKDYDAENLRKFKWRDRGKIECMTYDDLLNCSTTLSREMKSI